MLAGIVSVSITLATARIVGYEAIVITVQLALLNMLSDMWDDSSDTVLGVGKAC